VEESDLLSGYYYVACVPEKFERWMNFDASPLLDRRAPDFPLWDLDDSEMHLGMVRSSNSYTIVEFGSFT
jgi:hypothetical protein